MTSRNSNPYLTLARLSFPAAAVLSVAALAIKDSHHDVGGVLLALAGGLLILRGLLMLTRRKDVLEPLAELESRGIMARTGVRANTTYGSILLLFIGFIWAWIGVGDVLQA